MTKTVRTQANIKICLQSVFIDKKASTPMPNKRPITNPEILKIGLAGGHTNQNIPRRMASIKAYAPKFIQFRVSHVIGPGQTNLPGCWACNDFARRNTYSFASI